MSYNTKEQANEWFADIDPKSYHLLNKDALLFCFQQAEKRLTHALQITDKIVIRIYAWISGLIPVFSIALWVVTRKIIKADVSDPITDSLFFISWIVTLISLILLFTLLSIAYPKALPVMGREPRYLVKSDFLLNSNFNENKSLYLIVIYELEEYEARIRVLNESNEYRIHRLNIVFFVTKLVIASYVLFILAIYLVSFIDIKYITKI